jgi:DNA-binding NarL/FixJ family response regulator
VEEFGPSGAATVDKLERLSESEPEVLKLVAQGLTNRAIGLRLSISERTVHTHLINIFAKLGVSTRTEAALTAIRLGWLSLEDSAG